MKHAKKLLLIVILVILDSFSNTTIQVFSDLNKKPTNVPEESILETLRISKAHHIVGNFKAALKGYNLILNDSSYSESIKNETRIYELLAKAQNPVSAKYQYPSNSEKIVNKSKLDYKLKKYSAKLKHNYSVFGKYFDYDKQSYRECDDLSFHKAKIPMVKYNNEFQYNPITIEQYALSMYGKYLNRINTKDAFLNCANFLIGYTDEVGALRYKFSYNHYEDLSPGWTSSMAQGQALSVFARAYNLTHDKKYIEAGNKVFKYLITPISQGGVLDTLAAIDVNLKDKIFFQEYVNTTGSYTLNGYIFTLIGVYDWSQIEKDSNKFYSSIANDYFYKGIESLKCILPYYDIGGYTSYDLYYLTKKTTPNSSGIYHSVHIEQLDVLYCITNDSYFKEVRDLWLSYIL